MEYSDEEKELLRFAEANRINPEIKAHEALSKLFGEEIHVIEETGDEDYIDEQDMLFPIENELASAKLENSKDEIARLEKELDDTKAYLANRAEVSSAFYSEIADILSGHFNDSQLLKVIDPKPEHPIEFTRLLGTSVNDWMSKHVGNKLELIKNEIQKQENSIPIEATWSEIEIRLYSNQRLTLLHNRNKIKSYSFQELKLTNAKNNQANKLGGILLGLSKEFKFPAGAHAMDTDKTHISNLRKLLKNIVGLKSDPFYKFNAQEGWKPRFTISDRTNLADERAKDRATHTSQEIEQLPDERTNLDFEDEDDEAGRYLRESKK